MKSALLLLTCNGCAGYGSTVDEAVADLQLAYDEDGFDVFDFIFEAE